MILLRILILTHSNLNVFSEKIKKVTLSARHSVLAAGESQNRSEANCGRIVCSTRECPGSKLAYYSLFIAIAASLSAFEIKKKRNVEGNEITPPLAWTDDVVRLAYFTITML